MADGNRADAGQAAAPQAGLQRTESYADFVRALRAMRPPVSPGLASAGFTQGFVKIDLHGGAGPTLTLSGVLFDLVGGPPDPGALSAFGGCLTSGPNRYSHVAVTFPMPVRAVAYNVSTRGLDTGVHAFVGHWSEEPFTTLSINFTDDAVGSSVEFVINAFAYAQ